MTKSEINGYAMRVSQASKSELIVIMYEVAVKYIDDALNAISQNNVEEFRQNVRKAIYLYEQCYGEGGYNIKDGGFEKG